MGLHVEADSTLPISTTGTFWRADNALHQRYQERLLAHYRRQQRGRDSAWLQGVIEAYSRCC